jgi:hypothetical protein
VVDERLIGSASTDGLRIPYNSYFMSGNNVSPNEIDSLYTEMPLLELDWAPGLRQPDQTEFSGVIR